MCGPVNSEDSGVPYNGRSPAPGPRDPAAARPGAQNGNGHLPADSVNDTIELALHILAARNHLTPALERRLIEIGRGMSYREIARLHDLSVHTIKNEARMLLGSMGLPSRDLIEAAVEVAAIKFEDGGDLDTVVRYLTVRLESPTAILT
jgi:DNA-binding CsgD family transcriptional regulator